MLYLSERHLIRMNVLLIEQFSPQEDIGVRDFGALNMIVNQPQQTLYGEEIYPTLEEKAAILLINIIQRHPFHNGNKCTGFMALDTFLKLNGYTLSLSDEEKVDLAVSIATHRGDFDELKESVSESLKNHCQPFPLT